jgi:uncharacterized membrane protein YccC
LKLAKRSCHRIARKLGVVMHAMWRQGTFYIGDAAAAKADIAKRARPIGRTYDPLRAMLDGLRVAVVIAAAALFWIFSQWPDGPMFIIFALYVSLRYTMQREQAFDMGLSVLLFLRRFCDRS